MLSPERPAGIPEVPVGARQKTHAERRISRSGYERGTSALAMDFGPGRN